MISKKNILALVVVLAMILGTSTIAMAAPDSRSTDGSIEFEPGEIVIIIPGDCCDCFNKPAAPDCNCPCHDYPPPEGFEFGGDLNFGSWTVGDHGIFKTWEEGKLDYTLTGVYAINPTTSDMEVRVNVTKFIFDEDDDRELKGAELTLKNLKSDLVGSGTKIESPKLVPGEDVRVLLANPGSVVAANWYGILEFPASSSIYAGKAQAELTWTTENVA